LINLEKIKRAHEAISPYINRTPLVVSNYLSKNRIVKLKLESLQITNSFKLRGATNKLLSLDEEQKQKGVIAVSTGNHGKGVAYAASVLGIKSTIYIGNNSDEADLYAKKLSKEQNITLVHPFDDEDVIAGQGTVGLEMLEDFPDVDTVIIPTSGGGLIGGIALAIKLQKPSVKIIAVSMERGPSMFESLKNGKPTDVEELETLADCLGGSIGLDNQYTFKIAQETIDDFILVNEDKIAEGIKFNFVEHKLVTEGAAATGVMVVKDNMSNKLGNNIISLICGGNIDAKLFNKIIS